MAWRDTRLTYRQLDQRANRLAHGLEARGIGLDGHVGVYMYSRPEYLETMVASYKARAVPINVNYRYVGEELAYLFDDAELRVLVLEAGFAPIVASIRKQLPHLEHFIVVDDGSDEAEALPDAVAYEDVLAANVPTAGFGPRSADDAYIAYTGGTTGQPKGVLWRHEDIFFATMTPGVAVTRPEEVADNAVARSRRPLPVLGRPGYRGAPHLRLVCIGPLMSRQRALVSLGSHPERRAVGAPPHSGHGRRHRPPDHRE